MTGSLRVVFCARETAAHDWSTALQSALAQRGVPADIWWRDAGCADVDPAAVQADVAVVWRPPAALFTEQHQLRAIFNLGAGVDALLAIPHLPPQAALFRLEDAGMARALSEYVLAAVLRVYRRFDRYAVHQAAHRWQPEPVPARDDYAVGVLGLGVIGSAVAATLAQHGFAVRGHARTRKSIAGVDSYAGAVEFGGFLDGLDMLVTVLPATAETRGMLDHAALARLARGAHIVNVGRGSALIERDLLALLDAGHLGGATLDVFDAEPLPAAHPYWRHPSILLTPHVAAETELRAAIEQVADKLALWSRGDAVSGAVDRARGY